MAAGAGTVAVETVEVLPRVALEAASDCPSALSLSVSPRSRAGFMAGAASRKSNGSKPVPLQKNKTKSVHNSLQSLPAKAMNRCWSHSAFNAAAFCSSSADSLNRHRAWKQLLEHH